VCVAEGPDLLRYEAVTLGELWPTFRKMIMPSKAQRSFETAVTILVY